MNKQTNKLTKEQRTEPKNKLRTNIKMKNQINTQKDLKKK